MATLIPQGKAEPLILGLFSINSVLGRTLPAWVHIGLIFSSRGFSQPGYAVVLQKVIPAPFRAWDGLSQPASSAGFTASPSKLSVFLQGC